MYATAMKTRRGEWEFHGFGAIIVVPPQQIHTSNQQILVPRIVQPPVMMENGIRAGCATSTVEIARAAMEGVPRAGMYASTVEKGPGSGEMGVRRRSRAHLFIPFSPTFSHPHFYLIRVSFSSVLWSDEWVSPKPAGP